MKHTPRKWEVESSNTKDGYWDIVDENNNTIFTTNNLANAKRIVRCVNNFDRIEEDRAKLLKERKALEEKLNKATCLLVVRGYYWNKEKSLWIKNQTKEAIMKAGEEKVLCPKCNAEDTFDGNECHRCNYKP